jgi:cellulose synthase/poly-beta-1,6-N-acetylglucosamine synthase-like glycosyltransferase
MIKRTRTALAYELEASETTGPLQPTSAVVKYRKATTKRQFATILMLGCLHLAYAAALVVFLLLPGNLPLLSTSVPHDLLTGLGLTVMVLLQGVAIVRTWNLMWFATHMRDPIPTQSRPGLRVAVLTTIVPAKEPVEMVMKTLRAIKQIRHDGPVDVWLLDEGDDPAVRQRCEAMGVRHFSRKGHPEWNRPSGEFRAKSKAGNHNAWRSVHENDYDVVAQMDPDHVPHANFLERTLGYFADPDTGFVVAPQAYGNQSESFVARGSAEMAYLFHGVTQRGANGLSAPLLIGTNHLYRPSCWHDIGGYQDSIIEDHLTSMAVCATINPATGNHWRGVYTPDVLAVGEGPANYTDFFSQQKRWAYGIWEVVRHHSPRLLPKMHGNKQRLSYVTLQNHYPNTAIGWVAGVFLSAIYLVGGVQVTRLPLTIWAIVFVPGMILAFAFIQYLRRFNLAEHERKSWGLHGMALELITGPVFVAAGAAQVAGRRLVYVVTPKAAAATTDSIRAFRAHLGWAAGTGLSVAAGILFGHDYWTFLFWAGAVVVICTTPVVVLLVIKVRQNLKERRNVALHASELEMASA